MILHLKRHHVDLLKQETKKVHPIEACAMLFGKLSQNQVYVEKIEVAQNEVKYIGVLESMYYKAPSDGKVTIEVLDPDGTTFSGTVTNVNFEVIELPKGIND